MLLKTSIFRIQIFNALFVLLHVSLPSEGLPCWSFTTETAANSLYFRMSNTCYLTSFQKYLTVLINGHDEANSDGWQTTVMQFYQLLFDHETFQNNQWKSLIQRDSRKWILWLLVVANTVQRLTLLEEIK